MNKKSISLLFVILCAIFSTFHTENVYAQKTDDEVYLFHKVKKGETLWSISKDYKVSLSHLLSINSFGKKDKLKINQLIKIKEKESFTTLRNSARPTHIVQKGESLYSIAKRYKCSVDDLKKLNTLGKVLQIGQKLVVPAQKNNTKRVDNRTPSAKKNKKTHIVSAGETVYSIAKKNNVTQEKIMLWNDLDDNTLHVGQKLILMSDISTKDVKKKEEDKKDMEEDISKKKTEDNAKNQTENQANDHYEEEEAPLKEVREKGFAELIELDVPSKKYSALHKTAKKGTYIKVTNEQNSKWIYVRVIGNIPKGTADDNVVIKISPSAYKKLSAVNKKFPVSIHYLD